MTSLKNRKTSAANPSTPAPIDPGVTLVGEDVETSAYGPPWTGINGTGVTAGGTDLRSAPQRYIVAADPNTYPLGTYLYIKPNPFNTGEPFLVDDTGSAIKGNRIDFYDWRGRASQLAWGMRPAQAIDAKGTAGIDPNATPNGMDPVSAAAGGALDMLSLVGDFVGTILNFQKLGELAAKAVAWFIKVIAQAIWEYVLEPIVEWNKRAVNYYWDAYFVRDKALLGSDAAIYKNAGWVTVGFWAFGYGILWAKAETNEDGRTRLGLAESPRQSMLGKTIQRTQQTAAKRHVTSAKKAAEKATAAKPAAVHSSKSPIKQTRTLTVTRRRPVQVGGSSTTQGRGRALAPAN